jgi:hypothetical protein
VSVCSSLSCVSADGTGVVSGFDISRRLIPAAMALGTSAARSLSIEE